MKHHLTGRTLLPLFIAIVLSGCSVSKNHLRLVMLPDTQTYAEKFPEVLHSQADWIVENGDNIDFVLQQGDLTDDNNDEQWKVVKAAFEKLDAKVPYTVAVGNHDTGSGPSKNSDVRNNDLFNQYFPSGNMAKNPAFGGTFEPGRMENVYYRFKKGKYNWLIMTLEFGPRDKVLDWANQVVAKFPQDIVILNTHCYMYSDSTRVGEGDTWRPQSYGLGKSGEAGIVNDGDQIWEKLVRKNPNIRFAMSGHILHDGIGTLVSQNDAGLPVYQFLLNFQGGVKGSVNGGNGFLRIMDIWPTKKLLEARSWSPYIKEFYSKPGHSFTFKGVNLDIK